ncbi:MAG TPA: RnfABCDGE type electron transport complex subunit B [Methylococcus sp.]|nr:RnfABCDGE type electron transport complex subunit B [Methylococcus sp.]
MYIVLAIFSLTALGLTLGLVLAAAARVLKVESDPLVDELEVMLPGFQCGQCGHPGCRPAVEALAAGRATVTLCPPGGPALAQRLADKLGVVVDGDSLADPDDRVAWVREENCIGCTRCFKVCPTDAIVGAPKQIHTVLAEACIACGKCLEACPTECLQLQRPKTTLHTWRWPKPRLHWEGARAC